MFEKGDIVECVDAENSFPKLNNGATYIVNDTCQCPKCKKYSVDVGIIDNRDIDGSKCGSCDYEDSDTSKIAWYAPARFRKIGTLYRTVEIASEIKEMINEVLETPDIATLKK